MIIVPKYHDRVIPVRIAPKMSGRFIKAEAFKGRELADGTVLEIPGTRRDVSHLIPNMIVENGLDLKGSTDLFNRWCHVGTGTATPAYTDTSLDAYDRGNDTEIDEYTDAEASSPHFGSHVKTHRFNPPGTAKNYNELATAPAKTTGNIFNRALTQVGGTPTTISIQDDEYLDVTYELRLYPDHLTDGSASVDGYSLTLRAAEVTSDARWGQHIKRQAGFPPGAVQIATFYSGDATLGAITTTPSASASEILINTGEGSASAYLNNSYSRAFSIALGPTQANLSGGIGAMQVNTTLGAYQIAFSPAIPKTSSDSLTIDMSASWSEATIP